MWEFSLTVMYSQIIIYDASVSGLGLIWSEEESQQGFAWDNQMVAFGVPDHDGICLIQATEPTHFFELSSNSLWAIEVPIVVNTKLNIGTILNDKHFDITPGAYRLIFEAFEGEKSYKYQFKLTFVKSLNQKFEILKQGIYIRTPVVLRTKASRV